jgi:hypothetical protein
MAALPNETKPVVLQTPGSTAAPMRERREDPRIRLAQLARLHDEAARTATLANLLGRTPQAMIVLSLGALALAAFSFGAMPTAPIMVWGALMAAGVVAIWRAYARAIEAPFELFALKTFSSDLAAVLFYTGFAWGAGAFLALPAQASPLAITLFAAVPAGLVAVLLRARVPALFFLAPVVGLATLATLIRPMGGVSATATVVLACAAVAGLSYWFERPSAAEPTPPLAGLAVH